MGDQRPGYTLDDALSCSGFGTFQSLALVFAGVGWFSEAMEMNLLSFIGPAVKSKWSLSPTEESLLSTAVFGGMLIGAYFWGFVSDTYGRRMGIRGLSLVVAVTGLLSAFSPDYKSLVIVRCLLGFGVAGGHVYASWFLEFIPSSNRGSWMLSLLIFWTLGELFEASLAWIVMPRLGWRWLLALSSTPSLLVVIFSSCIPESPRYLFMKGKINEAQKVLERIALINGKEIPSGFLMSDLDEEKTPEEIHLLLSTREKKSSLNTIIKTMAKVFAPNLLRTTILLLLLHFGFTFAFYGIVLMISSLSSGQSLCGSSNTHLLNAHDTSLYRNVFITCSAEFPGFIIATVLMDRLGRKLTMTSLSMLTVILLIPLCFHQHESVTTALLFLCRMLLFAAFSSLTIYAKEVYPTSIRGSGSGLAVSVGRIGGMICPLVAVGLVRGCHQTLAVILFGIVILISGICVLFFPFETKGKGLADNLIVKMGDQRPGYTLDDALSCSGFGTFQSLALVFAGVGWFSEAIEMNLLSFIGPAVKSEWSLSPTQESLLSTAVFGGMLIGAYFWGFVSDSYGRRTGIQGIAIVVAAAGLLSAFSPDYKSLVVTRCLLGFGVAGGHVYASWFMEFIPSSNRGSWMLSMLIFWILGELFEAALAWVIMQRLGWRWLLGLSSTPSLLVVIFSCFIPESPRYLFMKGKMSEARNVLEKIALVNRKELPAGSLLSAQLEEGNSLEETLVLSSTRKKTSSLTTIVKTISEIFSPNLLRTTLLLLFLHFGFTFASYGITLMISSLSSEQHLCGSVNTHFKNVQDTNLYRNVFITSTAGFPGFLIATLLMDRLGRKLLMTTLSMITVIVLIPLCFHQSENVTTALLFLARMLLFATFSSLNIYAKEVYPTSIRGSGSGLAVSVGRIGGMVCPLVAVGLVRGCHQTLAVILFGIVIFISGVCILFFPFETKGKALTDIVTDA